MAERRNRSSLALLVASGGAFLNFLDATVTNLALPDIAADFEVADIASLSWVVTAYTVLFAAMLAPAGALADAVGRTRLFLTGVGIFTASSLTAAAAPSFEVLLVSRGVQGLAAALMIPASLAMVLAETPSGKRTGAIALWSAVGALAAAAGPPLGGLAVEFLGWRWLFCVNLPLGLWLLSKGRVLMVGEPRDGRLPDLVGSCLLAAAVGALVYGLTDGPSLGWTAPAVVGALAVSVVCGAATLILAFLHPRPALQVRMWRNRAFAYTTLVSALFGAVLYQVLLLGVLFLVTVWRYSILDAGLATTPAAVAAGVAGVVIRKLRRQPAVHVLVLVGCLLMAGTTCAMAIVLSAEPQFLAVWLPGSITLGFGIGAATVGVSTAGAMAVPQRQFAAATGLNSASRMVGGSLGVALLAGILTADHGRDPVAPFAAVYLAATALAALGALGAIGMRLPSTSDAGSDVDVTPEEAGQP